MKNFEKKYQVWSSNKDANEYEFQEFDTLAECIAAPKNDDWYITKMVVMEFVDVEAKIQTVYQNSDTTYAQTELPPEVRSDEEEPSAILDAYTRGTVGELSQS